ncbi:hypothetical protein [Olivibacter sp. XZL3]|uniref:hypothetical protein n=1 Tax=Olivibacter sp. XZL3 TaxID=1735116 RepID=UPI0010661316|nr:hypothetical protein [Olivibacter sp. XZL3]
MNKASSIQAPVFVIHELIIRLQEIDSLIGEYQSHYFNKDEAVVQTTNSVLHFPLELIQMQFQAPHLIGEDELRQQLPMYRPV